MCVCARVINAYVLGILPRLVLDADARHDCVDHAVVDVAKFLHAQNTSSAPANSFFLGPSQLGQLGLASLWGR